MLITTTDIQLYEILKQKIGSQEAEALVGFVDARIKEANEQNLKALATNEDVKDLKLELKKDIADVKLEIANVRVEIAATKTDILRWVYAIIIPLLIAVIGLYFRK